MKDFFINSLEKLITAVIILGAIAVVSTAVVVAVSGQDVSGQIGGPLMGLGILIGGALYLVLLGGFAYLAIGIYQNTKRTAEALEKQ